MMTYEKYCAYHDPSCNPNTHLRERELVNLCQPRLFGLGKSINDYGVVKLTDTTTPVRTFDRPRTHIRRAK